MGAIEVRRLRAGEWRELRDLRLAALAEAPEAFSTPLEEAAARAASRWQADAARGAEADTWATWVAVGDGRFVGMASGFDGGGTAELFQMFVRPEARRRGVGEALARSVADWARKRSHRVLELGVADDNGSAIRLYERCGFSATGEVREREEGNVPHEARFALPL